MKRISKKKQAKITGIIRRIERGREPNQSSRREANREQVRRYTEKLESRTDNQELEATGDELVDKEDGIVRFALQNPNGIRMRSDGGILQEVMAIQQLQLDVTAFPESNLSSRGQTKEVLETQLSGNGESVRLVQASARSDIAVSEYQPGGVV